MPVPTTKKQARSPCIVRLFGLGAKKTGPTSLTGLLFNIYPRLENLVVATVVGEVEIVVGAVVL